MHETPVEFVRQRVLAFPLGNAFGHDISKRLEGSLVAAGLAVSGGASILRVHDVAETRRAVDVAAGIRGAVR